MNCEREIKSLRRNKIVRENNLSIIFSIQIWQHCFIIVIIYHCYVKQQMANMSSNYTGPHTFKTLSNHHFNLI